MAAGAPVCWSSCFSSPGIPAATSPHFAAAYSFTRGGASPRDRCSRFCKSRESPTYVLSSVPERAGRRVGCGAGIRFRAISTKRCYGPMGPSSLASPLTPPTQLRSLNMREFRYK